MIEGLCMMVIALVLACASPAVRQYETRKQDKAQGAPHPLNNVFRLPPPSPPLEGLAREAERALEHDRMTRGMRGLRKIYDRA